MKRHQKLLVTAIIAVAILQFLPFGGILSLPFVFLNTHLHELFHALAAIATGGQAEKILVFADGSGVTPVVGGWITPIASAGYIGCAIVGGIMIYAGRTVRGGHRVFLWTAIALMASCLLFVRGDLVGIITGVCWTALLFLAARHLEGDPAIFAAQFLGALQCLNALQSFAILLQVSRVSGAGSDAAIMQQATGLPAIVWASAWAVLSALILIQTLRAAWHSKAA